MHIENFIIDVPETRIAALKQRLALTTLPDELDGSDWERGAPLADVKRLAARWASGYDWKEHEARINKTLRQFKARVPVNGHGEVDVHFVHHKTGNPNAVPLLFVHGWPGSFIEGTKLLPLLQGGNTAPAFDVIVPSLPNFGFSGATMKRGFALKQYAECMHNLMLGLGHTKYVTQGGDWGFFITRTMAREYPSSVLATHINMIRCDPPSFLSTPFLALQNSITPLGADEKAGLERNTWFLGEGSAYRQMQSTKPQTLGYSLADSPVGMLAWIYEKLHDWTDSYPWTDDEVLTWVSVYWFSTAGPAASVRIYYEAAHETPNMREAARKWVPRVKLATARFPKELGLLPRLWTHTMGPIVHASEHESGGHFAAWEKPLAVAADLNDMFRHGGSCYGLVPGRDGY